MFAFVKEIGITNTVGAIRNTAIATIRLAKAMRARGEERGTSDTGQVELVAPNPQE